MASLQWRQKDVAFCSVIWSSLNLLYYNKNRGNPSQFLSYEKTSCEGVETSPSTIRKSKHELKEANKSNSNKIYDFVIVGYGRSGKSAAQTLAKLCPKASIAVFDPLIAGQIASPSRSKKRKGLDSHLDYFPSMVHAVDPKDREIVGGAAFEAGQLHGAGVVDSKEVKVNYRHGMLISTGCRCAPIPLSLVDKGASQRTLELFSTKAVGSGDRGPSMSPEAVYAISRMAAEQGASVCVLGSGVEALFIALSAAYASRTHQSPSSNNYNTPNVALMFGDSSPLSRIIPSYLSVLISHRLRRIGIDVQERTLVRYLMSSTSPHTKPGSIEVHTVKAYDSLLTERSQSDLLIVAPSALLAHQSTASIPSTISNNKPWSQVMKPPASQYNNILTCFSQDSRILVNPQLNVSTNIYAAGSCAQYPDLLYGSYSVPGLSLYKSTLSGRVAATNMAQQYNDSQSWRKDYSTASNYSIVCNQNNPPIWSTNDIISKLNLQDNDHQHENPTKVFSSSGIQAFSIGECNSNTMSIHAFWWTNHSANIRKRQTINNSDHNTTTATTSADATNIYDKTQKITSPNKKDSSSKNTSSSSSYPVYGIGILYYVDNHSGKLRGILTWGINPNHIIPQHNHDDHDILTRLRLILQSNGQVINNTSNQNIYPLTIQDLSNESQDLIKTLSSKQENDISNHVIHPATNEIIKPFYRYTPAKNNLRRYITSNFGLTKLYSNDDNRNNKSNLFIPTTTSNNQMPFLLPRSIQSTAESNTNQSELQQQLYSINNTNKNDNNNHYSRPSKEDAIWMYQGEEDRLISSQQKQMDTFLSNIKQGKFRDGTDPLA